MCVGFHTHIIRDYKNFNPRVNARLTLLLYVFVTHTHEPNPLPVCVSTFHTGQQKLPILCMSIQMICNRGICNVVQKWRRFYISSPSSTRVSCACGDCRPLTPQSQIKRHESSTEILQLPSNLSFCNTWDLLWFVTAASWDSLPAVCFLYLYWRNANRSSQK